VVIPDSIEASAQIQIANENWYFTDVIGQIYAIEGISPAFDYGWS